MSQVRIVESIADVTNHLESGLNVKSVIGPRCPVNFLTMVRVSISTRQMSKLSKATARNELSVCQLNNETVSSNSNLDNKSEKMNMFLIKQ